MAHPALSDNACGVVNSSNSFIPPLHRFRVYPLLLSHSPQSTRHPQDTWTHPALQVATRLCKMAFNGPAAYAPSVMRAACALLPSSALPAFVQRLARSAEECLNHRSGGAGAVSAAHVLIQLMRDAPAHVAESATRLVEWVMDDLLQSNAIHEAGEQGCMEQMLDLSVWPTLRRLMCSTCCHVHHILLQAAMSNHV